MVSLLNRETPSVGYRLVLVALPAISLMLVTVAEVLRPSRGAASDTQETVRGVIISTHTDGSDWSSPAMRSTMEDIRELGADWVSIHPYGWIRANGAVRFHEFNPDHPPAYIVRPIEDAHALGLKILIKPHIGYWGSPFSHRGAIHFRSEVAWDRFFGDYKRWITHLAEACRGADAFVVGTELDSTLEHEDRWRDVIAEVRKRTRMPLTYAANWSSYRNVAFWDALDVIGIQAYFPLTEHPDPDSMSIVSGWESVMTELRDFAHGQNRKIAFTELGYNRSYAAPVEPWAYRVDGNDAERVQVRCLRIALQAVEREPTVVAVFLWKWFPNPYPVGRNFQLATPGMRRAIAEIWGS